MGRHPARLWGAFSRWLEVSPSGGLILSSHNAANSLSLCLVRRPDFCRLGVTPMCLSHVGTPRAHGPPLPVPLRFLQGPGEPFVWCPQIRLIKRRSALLASFVFEIFLPPHGRCPRVFISYVAADVSGAGGAWPWISFDTVFPTLRPGHVRSDPPPSVQRETTSGSAEHVAGLKVDFLP